MKKLLLTVFVLLTIALGCKKNSEQPQEFGDSLNEDDNAFLESVSVPNPSQQDIIGYDGNLLAKDMNRPTLVGNLVDAMLRYAQILSSLKTVTYKSEGINRPEHMGLVYSSGQRNITQRLNPPEGNNLHKKYAVYGTDCSGFIINLGSYVLV
jgi:hypothetical protein